jgi:hypothetical protein
VAWTARGIIVYHIQLVLLFETARGDGVVLLNEKSKCAREGISLKGVCGLFERNGWYIERMRIMVHINFAYIRSQRDILEMV